MKDICSLLLIAYLICFNYSLVNQNENIVLALTENNPVHTVQRPVRYIHILSDQMETEIMVREMSESRGWKESDIEKLVKLGICESSMGKAKVHHNDNGTIDRGMWMWNDYYHPEVSDECAYDLECSTNEIINYLNRTGSWDTWVCNNLLTY